MAQDGLKWHLCSDTLGLVIDYSRYSEIEKVWIALHYHKCDYWALEWRTFNKLHDVDDTGIDYVDIVTNPVNQTHARKRGYCDWKLGDQLKFRIELGSSCDMHPWHTIEVTTEDLVPSAGFRIDICSDMKPIIDEVRPRYLKEMQDVIDKI